MERTTADEAVLTVDDRVAAPGAGARRTALDQLGLADDEPVRSENVVLLLVALLPLLLAVAALLAG